MARDGKQAVPLPALTEDDLAAIKKRCDQTTTGPWKSYVEGRDMKTGSSFIMTGGEDLYLTGATNVDQDFIAHARQDIPFLILEIGRLRNIVAGLSSEAAEES